MDPEKLNINLAEGQTELIIREGNAPDILAPKPPMDFDIVATIGAVREFLSKRVGCGQFANKDCHIIVDRDHVSIQLVFNERDVYTEGTVKGSLQFHRDFEALGINSDKLWEPVDLAAHFKMHRNIFVNRDENLRMVSILNNYKADIVSKVEKLTEANGSTTDNFQKVVNSNLPPVFKLRMPIFKGYPAEEIEVETFANVNGRAVVFMLISPGANEVLESIRDKAIDEELNAIREIAPDIAIIEV